MIDEKKIEEAANKYAIDTYPFTDPVSIEYKEGIQEIFQTSINWFKENLWHDASEEPEQDKVVIIQLKEDGSWHAAIFVGIEFRIIDMNQEDDYLVFTDDTTCWFYIEDLMKGGE